MDYAKSTNFTALRGSTPADPAILDTEFTAVAAASATKLDKTGGTLTGALTGTTASFPSGVIADLTGNADTATLATTASACSGNSATATYATSAGTAVDATARATASAAVPKDVGVLGVGLLINAIMISGTCASGATVAGTSITYGLEVASTSGTTGGAVNVGTWRNVLGHTATTTEYSTFQRIS